MRTARTIAALALLAGACVRHPPFRIVDSQLLDVDAARAAAMVAGDAEAMDAILDDGLTYAHSNGRIDTKASLIDALASERVDYRVIDVGRRDARIFEHTGVVTGPVRIEVDAGGRRDVLRSVYTAVYWWRDGAWRLVAYHSSPVE